MKTRICCFIIGIIMLTAPAVKAATPEADGVEAKAHILIEHSTGRVLSEDNADEKLPIASVTKIMTMLLIMEAVDNGVITLDDMVPVSENAMSYGGSTMFLEAGEQLSVNDMLKGIAVASANDGCVAMAEFLAGSESAFVTQMNDKAKELGMVNTHFMNTNGLDEEGHYSTARDVAIMSRELLNHPKITDYTSIWTDELRDGKFQLANTNKLVRFYSGANGLKTGSTSQALCCLSAAAKRDNMQLIAVVLGSPTSDKRFASAKKLLDYGFAGYRVVELVSADEEICDVNIANGTQDTLKAVAKETKTFLCEKANASEVQRRVLINDGITAPVNEGDAVGYMEFLVGENVVDKVELVARDSVDKKGYFRVVGDLILGFM